MNQCNMDSPRMLFQVLIYDAPETKAFFLKLYILVYFLFKESNGFDLFLQLKVLKILSAISKSTPTI